MIMTTPNRQTRRAEIAEMVKGADKAAVIKATEQEIAQIYQIIGQRANICLNPACVEQDYKQFSDTLAQIAQAMTKLKNLRRELMSNGTTQAAKRKR